MPTSYTKRWLFPSSRGDENPRSLLLPLHSVTAVCVCVSPHYDTSSPELIPVAAVAVAITDVVAAVVTTVAVVVVSSVAAAAVVVVADVAVVAVVCRQPLLLRLLLSPQQQQFAH